MRLAFPQISSSSGVPDVQSTPGLGRVWRGGVGCVAEGVGCVAEDVGGVAAGGAVPVRSDSGVKKIKNRPNAINAVPTTAAVFCLAGSTVILPANDPAMARIQKKIPATMRMVGSGV